MGAFQSVFGDYVVTIEGADATNYFDMKFSAVTTALNSLVSQSQTASQSDATYINLQFPLSVTKPRVFFRASDPAGNPLTNLVANLVESITFQKLVDSRWQDGASSISITDAIEADAWAEWQLIRHTGDTVGNLYSVDIPAAAVEDADAIRVAVDYVRPLTDLAYDFDDGFQGWTATDFARVTDQQVSGTHSVFASLDLFATDGGAIKTLRRTLEFPVEGSITFKYRYHAEYGGVVLRLGNVVLASHYAGQVSGGAADTWHTVTYTIPAGTHDVNFSVNRDGDNAVGDGLWIDDIEFTNAIDPDGLPNVTSPIASVVPKAASNTVAIVELATELAKVPKVGDTRRHTNQDGNHVDVTISEVS